MNDGILHVPSFTSTSIYQDIAFNFAKPVKQGKQGEQGEHISHVLKIHIKKAVVFDIDGTLAITTNRSAFEWDKVCNDKVNHKVAELVEYYKDKGFTIIVLSGRDSVCRDLTIKWLNDNGIYFDELYMRTKNDYRRDVIVKMELYAQYVYPNYNVELVYDDRAQVTTLWRGLGLTCFQVASGRF